MQQFANPADAQTLALAIVEAIPDPIVVLDSRFRIVAANRSFAEAFNVDAQESHNELIFNLSDGAWDIAALRKTLAGVFADHSAVDGQEVEGCFAGGAVQIICVNARLVEFAEQEGPMLLLGVKDITARRESEREKAELQARTSDLLEQQKILVREIQHRVANSLQIIASILMLKTRAVRSAEAREHLQDAHERVLSVAQVQSLLSSAEGIDQIDLCAYLSKLCEGLASSMIGPDKPIELVFASSTGGTICSSKAVSIGLIVTELVLNSIKHAFPEAKSGASIRVGYETDDDRWTLAVRDNGVGTAEASSGTSGGLGTPIVEALASQLGATITTTCGARGRTVVVGPAEIAATLPLAA